MASPLLEFHWVVLPCKTCTQTRGFVLVEVKVAHTFLVWRSSRSMDYLQAVSWFAFRYSIRGIPFQEDWFSKPSRPILTPFAPSLRVDQNAYNYLTRACWWGLLESWNPFLFVRKECLFPLGLDWMLHLACFLSPAVSNVFVLIWVHLLFSQSSAPW